MFSSAELCNNKLARWLPSRTLLEYGVLCHSTDHGYSTLLNRPRAKARGRREECPGQYPKGPYFQQRASLSDLAAPIRASCELHYASVHTARGMLALIQTKTRQCKSRHLGRRWLRLTPWPWRSIEATPARPHRGTLESMREASRCCFRSTLFQVLPAGLSLVLAAHASCRSKSIPHLAWRLQSSPGFNV